MGTIENNLSLLNSRAKIYYLIFITVSQQEHICSQDAKQTRLYNAQLFISTFQRDDFNKNVLYDDIKRVYSRLQTVKPGDI